MPQAKSLRDLMLIRAQNRDYLDSINNNLGTALGFKKRTGQPLSKEPAIIVVVPLKINPKWIPKAQTIPEKLEGPSGLWCALDVVEGGKAEKETPVSEGVDELSEMLRGWNDKVWAGSQVSHWVNEDAGEYSIGTIGGFAKNRKDGAIGLLTNQHVGIQPGQDLYHPVPWGTHIATTDRAIEWVKEDDWYDTGVGAPSSYVRADCAFAKLAPGFDVSDINAEMMGVGQLGSVKPISLDDMSIIGRKVLRVGRTTGLRYGTITAFSYEFIDEKNETGYTDLLIAGDNGIPFSTHGDSGSLIILNNEELNPIGLLWGGWDEKLRTGYAQENWTWGISLGRVLDALDIDLIIDPKEIQAEKKRSKKSKK